MTQRKRSRLIARYNPADFLTSDGWTDEHSILDATPLLPSLAVAEAEWERCRAATWALWAEDPASRAPVAAERHDGITNDPASVDEFRARRPGAAAEIGAELEQYVAVCRRQAAQ